MAQRYEYRVVELRERMLGGKMSGDKLEKALNDHAREGWQLKAITSVEVSAPRVSTTAWAPGDIFSLSDPGR